MLWLHKRHTSGKLLQRRKGRLVVCAVKRLLGLLTKEQSPRLPGMTIGEKTASLARHRRPSRQASCCRFLLYFAP